MKTINIVCAAISAAILAGCSGGDSGKDTSKDFNLDILPSVYGRGSQEHYCYWDFEQGPVIELKGHSFSHLTLNLFYQGRAYVKTEDFQGFIDTEGNELFAVEGISNNYMTEGLAMTYDPRRKIVTAYDNKGDEVFTLEEALGCGPMREGYAVYSIKDRKLGLIDSKGEIIIDASDDENIYTNSDFNSIAAAAHPTYYQIVSDDGFAYILDVKTGKHYLEDCLPNEVKTWKALTIDSNNLVVAETENDRFGLLDLDGNWVVEPEYSYLRNDGEWYIFRENGLYGWMDKKGEVKIEPIAQPPHYCRWLGFGHGDISYIGNGSFIDRNGNIVLETDYSIDSNFIGDRCLIDKGRAGNAWINRDGEEIGDPFILPDNALENIRQLSIGTTPQYTLPLFNY